MLNVAHAEHDRHTCISVTNAALKHENTETCNRRDTPSRKTKGTEANMLSGMTRKSYVRSTFYWLTESCNPQLLPHFVAPFIVSSPRHPSPDVVQSKPICHQMKWTIANAVKNKHPKKVASELVRPQSTNPTTLGHARRSTEA